MDITMPSSGNLYQQLVGIQGQLNPLLDSQSGAPEFIKKGLNTAFDNNLPLLKQAAALQAGAYSLPGELMNQYQNEFGTGFGGSSAVARLNSVLGRLGTQFGLANVASGLADQQGARINDLSSSILAQYQAGIQALKDKYAMIEPLFNTAVGREESAANRKSTNDSNAINFPKLIEDIINNQPQATGTTLPSNGIRTNINGSTGYSNNPLNLGTSYSSSGTNMNQLPGYFNQNYPSPLIPNSSLLQQYSLPTNKYMSTQ